jgi:hypothetical protein
MKTVKQPYTTRNLDVNIMHVTKHDIGLLNREEPTNPVICYQYNEGYFIYVPGENNNVDIRKYRYSPAFINLFCVAQRIKCTFINLDRDGVIYSDLPVYTW